MTFSGEANYIEIFRERARIVNDNVFSEAANPPRACLRKLVKFSGGANDKRRFLGRDQNNGGDGGSSFRIW